MLYVTPKTKPVDLSLDFSLEQDVKTESFPDKAKRIVDVQGFKNAAAFVENCLASEKEPDMVNNLNTVLDGIKEYATAPKGSRILESGKGSINRHLFMVKLHRASNGAEDIIQKIKEEEGLLLLYGPNHDKSKLLPNGTLISGCIDIPSSVEALFEQVEYTLNHGDRWEKILDDNPGMVYVTPKTGPLIVLPLENDPPLEISEKAEKLIAIMGFKHAAAFVEECIANEKESEMADNLNTVLGEIKSVNSLTAKGLLKTLLDANDGDHHKVKTMLQHEEAMLILNGEHHDSKIFANHVFKRF